MPVNISTTTHKPLSARLDPRVNIYALIMLLATYAVLDSNEAVFTWGSYFELFAISLITLFALGAAHYFSEILDLHIREERRATWAERRHLAATNLQFLALGGFVAIILLLPLVFGWTEESADSLLFFAGLAALFGWGIYAGRAAKLSKGRTLLFGFNYLVIGMLIVVLKLLVAH